MLVKSTFTSSRCSTSSAILASSKVGRRALHDKLSISKIVQSGRSYIGALPFAFIWRFAVPSSAAEGNLHGCNFDVAGISFESVQVDDWIVLFEERLRIV